MNGARPSVRICILAIATTLFSSAALEAQATSQQPYKPTVGQPGKDAVWVPTSIAMVEKMLDMAKVTPQDFVIDLGSGDGRTIIAAAKRGARGLGVEYNNDLVELSKRTAAAEGVANKASFMQSDMYAVDISKATVLALFLLPSNLVKLEPKFLDLKPGSRIVANTFWIPDWEPDETYTMQDDCDSWCTVQLFIIPAKVHGTWQLAGGALSLTQTYQMLSGTLTANGSTLAVKGRLRGDEITFTAGTTQYTGRVAGNSMHGTTRSGSRNINWSATK